MSELYEIIEAPDLDQPTLVLGLAGWIDAGLAAANAFGTILEDRDLTTVAVFDSDALLDHRSRRPIMHIDEGVNTGLTWPSIELRAGFDEDGNSVLFLVGAEPDHRWRAFSRSIVDLSLHFGVSAVFGLGAYPAAVPHTRPTRLVSTATDAEMARVVGGNTGRIDVPDGVHAAIERACADAGIGATGLWAQIPHYAAGMPYPGGALALVDGLRTIADVAFPLGSLLDDAATSRRRLDELIDGNDEHIAMVHQLEAQYDAEVAADSLPREFAEPTAGATLMAELEEFLRDQE